MKILQQYCCKIYFIYLYTATKNGMVNITLMSRAFRHADTTSHITVTLDTDGVITCVMRGHITEALVKKSMAQTALFVHQVQAKGHNVLLLIDASKVKTQTSGARSQSKLLAQMGIEKIAVCGPNPALSLVVQYLIRSGGMAKYAQVFRTHASAKRWLLHKTAAKVTNTKKTRVAIAGMLGIVVIAALVGWATGNDYLKAIIPTLKPINPVSALALGLLALSVAVIGKYGTGKWIARGIPLVTGLWSVTFGLVIALRTAFGEFVPIDTWLFSDAVQNSPILALTAPRSGYMFICVGVMLLSVLTGQKALWQRVLFAIASTGAFIIPVGAIINYGFGIEVAFAAPTSLTTSFGILFINYALQTVARQTRIFEPIWHAFHKYAPALLVCASLAIVSGIAWQQGNSELDRSINTAVQQEFTATKTAIADRLDGYINTLRGFRSFFESSDTVTPDEFRSYFRTSELEKNYPGFTAMTFVQSVPAGQRDPFNNQIRRTFASTSFPRYKDFAVYPITSLDTLYPTLLVQPSSSTTNYGFDLGSNDTRRDTLERARDSGNLAASNVIDLNAARNDPSLGKRPGFYLTLPVYHKGTEPTTEQERRTHIFGFVNALFESSILFNNVFKNEKNTTVKYVVSNARSGETLHTFDGGDPGIQADLQRTEQLDVGGQVWRLDMYTTPLFGAENLAQGPTSILVTGGILTMLGTAITVILLRRRDHAVQLAESMTEDLNNERDAAVVAQQKDEAVLSSIGDAVFAVDRDGTITLFNPSAETISGFTKEEAIGKHYRDVLQFILEKDGSVHDSFIRQALDGRLSSMKNHTMLIRKDGSKIAVADSAAPIRSVQGRLLGAIIVFRDVTRENELDRAKSEFVSLASHQLRTPLSAIGWYSEMLLSGDVGKLTKAQKEQVTEIYEGNQRMVDLVNSLLNVSRLELGKLQNDAAPTSLTEIAHSLEQELKPSVAAKHMTLNMHIDETLPKVTADPKLLRMIVQNLMSNAVKYTPEKGSVEVVLHSAAKEMPSVRSLALKEPLGKYVFIKVTDTGYGIPKAQQAKIFQKMFRADNVRELDVEGTGLGLYIVREVVQKLGGKIWFESHEGKGTTFYVVLPLMTTSSVLKP